MKRRLLKTALFAGLFVAALIVLTGLLFIAQPDATQLPGFAQVKSMHSPSDAQLLDRHGEVIQTRRIAFDYRRLAWRTLDEVSQAVHEAVVQAEDRRFFEHTGVDWYASIHAAWQSVTGNGRRGASTISMQVAASLAPDEAGQSGTRALVQKWRQMQLAQQLERHWSKPQILEAYLNGVVFRGELHGIGAAAFGLFGKAPSGLNKDEAALLAALLRAPNAAPGLVAQRACRLRRARVAACARLQNLSRALRQTAPLQAQVTDAPHVGQRLLVDARHTGDANDTIDAASNITTTLAASVQRHANTMLRQRLLALSARNGHDAALIVMDNGTGDVLAYVGNGADMSTAHYVDGVTALRQAGSTLKPFLYGQAIDQRLLTAASVLDDSPLSLPTAVGTYSPQNYDRNFKGKVSVRTALAASLNVPAVRTLALISPDAFATRLGEWGYAGITESGDYYGHALALGSAEVTLLEQANAYRALANGGVWSAARFGPDDSLPDDSRPDDSPRATPKALTRRVMSEQAAFIIADILSDRAARGTTFGLTNPLSTPFWTAVKTGTTKDMRDNWCIGFSRRYTVGVWVGNFNGEPMHDVSGISGAAPLWHDMMMYLHRNTPSTQTDPPPEVVAQRVVFDAGVERPRHEWFLPGTEQSRMVLSLAPAPRARIIYPTAGSIIALDPDIPAGRQVVFLQATSTATALSWQLNGAMVGSASDHVRWRPTAGWHRAELVDQRGRAVDVVEFEVRG